MLIPPSKPNVSYINTVVSMEPIVHCIYAGPIRWPGPSITTRPPTLPFEFDHSDKYIYRRNEFAAHIAGLRTFQHKLTKKVAGIPRDIRAKARSEVAEMHALITVAKYSVDRLPSIQSPEERDNLEVQKLEEKCRAHLLTLTKFLNMRIAHAIIALNSDRPVQVYFEQDLAILGALQLLT